MSPALKIQGRVLGGAGLREAFAECGGRLRTELRQALSEIGQEARARASVLAPRRFGKLQDTMKMKVSETNKSIRAEVYPGRSYGFILSFGVDRDVTNPRHRTVKVAAPTTITTSGRVMRIGRARKRTITLDREDKRSGRIRYTKHLKIAPRPFMRLAFEGMKSAIDPIIDAAVSRATERT